MPRSIPILLVWIFLSASVIAQNTGIGTNSPQAKLHVNGDLRLQNGDAVNAFSRDSLFSSNSHLKVPTEKAVKDFIQKGNWVAPSYTTAGPNAPAFLGTGILPFEQGNGVACSGNFAYVIGINTNQLCVLDITDPRKTLKRGIGFGNINGASCIAVQGNYAYIPCAGSNRLSIFDISNPDLPIEIGNFLINTDQPTDIVVKGNYAYIASETVGNVAIYDISNPTSIIYKGNGGNFFGKVALELQGNYIYATSTLGGELRIYDISDPLNMVYKGMARDELLFPRDVAVSGNMAYVASQDNGLVAAYDISNPLLPVYKGGSGGLVSPGFIKVIGNYLAVTTSGDTRLTILDLNTPGFISRIGSNNGSIVQATGIAIAGNTICVSNKGDVKAICLFDLDFSRSVGITSNGISPIPETWQTQGKNIYKNNGNVGIGTSSPLYDLDVAGTIRGSNEIKTASLNATNVTITTANITNGVFNSGTFSNIYTYNALVNGQLAFNNSLDSKISFYGYGTANQYGIGVQSGLLQLYTDAPFADIAFGYGSSSSFTERMRIKGNGNVGIGIINPSNPLSFPATLGKKISLYPGGTGDVGMSVSGNDLRLYSDNVNARVSFGYDSYVSGFISRAYIPASGTIALVAQGNINANGIVYNSDIRYKKKIATINNSLDKVLKLRGVVYEMRTDEFPTYSFSKGQQMGLIAQEVESIVPEVVSTNKDGYKSVDYAKLVPLLIESIKAQQKEIEELKRLIKVK